MPERASIGRDSRQLGADLARIHQLDHRPARYDVFPQDNTDNIDRWDEFIGMLRPVEPQLADLAADAAPAVRMIGDLMARSVTDFGDQPMSHGDIDQKNLIMTTQGPVLCDWDVAAPWPPRQELARTALSLAGWQDREIAQSVIHAYRKHDGDIGDIRPEDLAVHLRIGLDWIVMVTERAAGLQSTDVQRRREAIEASPRLLGGLSEHVRHVLGIERWLDQPSRDI